MRPASMPICVATALIGFGNIEESPSNHATSKFTGPFRNVYLLPQDVASFIAPAAATVPAWSKLLHKASVQNMRPTSVSKPPLPLPPAMPYGMPPLSAVHVPNAPKLMQQQQHSASAALAAGMAGSPRLGIGRVKDAESGQTRPQSGVGHTDSWKQKPLRRQSEKRKRMAISSTDYVLVYGFDGSWCYEPANIMGL